MWAARKNTRVIMVGIALLCLSVPPATGQGLQGRFYPEKATFLAGEPVFIDLEIVNTGKETISLDSMMGKPCLFDDTFEVAAERTRHVSDGLPQCFGGIVGDCASSFVELKPGQKHTERNLLNEIYEVDEPGIYEIKAHRQVPYSTTSQSAPEHRYADFSSEFTVAVSESSKEELLAAFQPVLKDLRSPDSRTSSQAILAITDLAPPFLEDVITKLAANPNTVAAGIEGLRRLNTETARAKLADLAERARGEWGQQPAIIALALTGDRNYLPVLSRIARRAKPGTREIAIEAAGTLGGEDAVVLLTELFNEPDASVRQAAVQGLANTVTREAVPVLIRALQDPNDSVRHAAVYALAQLTHRSATSEVWEDAPAPELGQRWARWWTQNGKSAPIYGPKACAEPQVLE